MNKKSSMRWILIILGLFTVLTSGLLITDIILHWKESAELELALIILSVTISLFFYSLLIYSVYRSKYTNTSELISSINSIEAKQEEIFEVGVILFNSELSISYISPWLINEGFSKFIGSSIKKIDIDFDSIKKQKWEYSGRTWEVLVLRRDNAILLKDTTDNEVLKDIVKAQQIAVASVHLGFSKKVSLNELAKSQLTMNISQSLQSFANKADGLYLPNISVDNTAMVIFRWKKARKNINNEELLNQVKQSLGPKQKEVNISIGISYGNIEISELYDRSLRTLELSKNRGGDQIVIERPNTDVEYIGSSSIKQATSDILNIRKFWGKLVENLGTSKEIFISSHKNADLDALGSALGLYDIVKTIKSNVYIVLPNLDNTSKTLFESYPKTIKGRFITEAAALKMQSHRSHLIITDTSLLENSQITKLIEKTNPERLSIIDHHRMVAQDFDFNEENILIETNRSSTSEIVTEIMKLIFSQDAQYKISGKVSTTLLAGIQLDTKLLTKNTSNSTYDAISFLLNNDASNLEAQLLFKLDNRLIKLEALALSNITRPTKDIAFTFIPEDIVVDDEVPSIIADKLLTYQGIEASFALCKTKLGKYKVSARSNTKINVQKMCESLGGGGHFNASAASWNTSTSYNSIKKRINNIIIKKGK